MKELVYKNIVGNNPRKREISIEEISSKKEPRVEKKWICKYFIKEKYRSRSMNNIREWVKREKKNERMKNCHILRENNTRTGESKIICKLLGEIFVICGMTVYKIVYVNEIRVKIE
ncbi:MAG: hypothetical protein U9R44_04380 [Candidatus Omnitrophota bacterium]|nr:hypothetical protein [Candidatus Omnitrophota bacterium]